MSTFEYATYVHCIAQASLLCTHSLCRSPPSLNTAMLIKQCWSQGIGLTIFVHVLVHNAEQEIYGTQAHAT